MIVLELVEMSYLLLEYMEYFDRFRLNLLCFSGGYFFLLTDL